MANRKIRVRSKRLEQISADKLALALWLMARDYADRGMPNSLAPEASEEKPLESDTEAT
jgi:hypothetical protein